MVLKIDFVVSSYLRKKEGLICHEKKKKSLSLHKKKKYIFRTIYIRLIIENLAGNLVVWNEKRKIYGPKHGLKNGPSDLNIRLNNSPKNFHSVYLSL